jgi:hypothetical protein
LFREGDRAAKGRPPELVAARDAYRRALEMAQGLDVRWEFEAVARKRYEDVERYLVEGQALVTRASSALLAARREEAFATLVEARNRYEFLPALAAQILPVRVITVPAGARVSIPETGFSAAAPCDIDLPLSSPVVTVSVRLEGFADLDLPLTVPPPRYEVVVAFDRPARRVIETGEPIVGGAIIGGDTPAFAARNGRMLFFDAAGDGFRRVDPGGIRSTRLPPIALSSGLSTVSEFGELWLVSPDGTTRAQTATPPVRTREPLAALAAGDGVLLLAAPAAVGLLSAASGALRWEVELHSPPKSAAALSRRAAILLEDGSVSVRELSDGRESIRYPGPFVGEAAADSRGRLILHRQGKGLVAMSPGEAGETLLAKIEGAPSAGPMARDEWIAVAYADRTLLILGPSGQRTVALPDIAVAIHAGADACVALSLASGSHLVVDLSGPSLIMGARGLPNSRAVPVLTADTLFIGHDTGKVLAVPLR